eukprot:gene9187-1477_t
MSHNENNEVVATETTDESTTVTEDSEQVENVPEKPNPVKVKYCPTCTLPYEYCEFSPLVKQCYIRLKQEDPELFTKMLGDRNTILTSMFILDDNHLTAKKNEQAAKEIVVTRTPRGKKKFATTIGGLKAYANLDLKKASKVIAGRFAASSSVVSDDEIQVTGDITADIADFLSSKFSEIKADDVKIVIKAK